VLILVSMVQTSLFAQFDCGTIIIGPPQRINQSDTFFVDISYTGGSSAEVDSINVTIDFGEDATVDVLNAASFAAPTIGALFVLDNLDNSVDIRGKVSNLNDFINGVFCRIRYIQVDSGCVDIRLVTEDFPPLGAPRKITFLGGEPSCPVSFIGSNNRVVCNDDITISGEVLFAVGDQSLSTDTRRVLAKNFIAEREAFTASNAYTITLPSNSGGFSTTVSVDTVYEFNSPLDIASCGIDIFDVIDVRQHILAIDSFEHPWQYFAADANSNGQIRVSDITTMIRVILGIDVVGSTPAETTMPFPWAYPSLQDLNAINIGDSDAPIIGHIFPAISSDQDSINFFAVKRGDVTGDCPNYNNLQPDDPVFEKLGSHNLTIYDRAIVKNQTVYVDVDVAALTENKVVTLSMGFNTDNLDIELIESGKQKVEEGTFTTDPVSGQLTLVWVPDTLNLFPAVNSSYRFRIKARKTLPTLAGSVWLNADVVSSKIYDIVASEKSGGSSNSNEKTEGLTQDLVLHFVNDKSYYGNGVNSFDEVEDLAFDVTPINPARGDLEFVIYSPESEELYLEIYNLAGQEVASATIWAGVGESVFRLAKGLLKNKLFAA